MPTPPNPSLLDDVTLAYAGPAALIATDRKPQAVRLTVRFPAGLPTGSVVMIGAGKFRSVMNGAGFGWAHARVIASGGQLELVAGCPQAFHELNPRLRESPDWRVAVAKSRVIDAMQPGAKAVFDFDLTPSPQSGFAGYVDAWVQLPDAEAPAHVGDTIELVNQPGRPTAIEVRPAVDSAGRVRLTCFAIDDLFNPVPNARGSITLTADGKLPGLPDSVDFDDKGRAAVEGLQPADDAPVIRVTARDDANHFVARSGPIVPAMPDGKRCYFGEIHWHCDFSGDGDRPLVDAYDYARHVINLGFASVSDHSPRADLWERTVAINDAAHAPDQFVTLHGWEWSTNRGHANIYLRHPDVDADTTRVGRDGIRHPAETDWPADVFVVPHHTNIRSAQRNAQGEHYWWEYDWHKPNRRVRLVELIQGRGNFEGDQLDDDWGIVTGDIGASVQDALNMGYRIGFTGGTDNHNGYPTRSPNPKTPGYIGMTGVWANELTREAIWDALNDRRTFATSGLPIVAHWKIGDAFMGEEATHANGEPLTFSASLHGVSPIERIEIIGNGKVVWSITPEAPASLDVVIRDEPLPRPSPAMWYYLRLRQSDGHRAWCSPIWVDEV